MSQSTRTPMYRATLPTLAVAAVFGGSFLLAAPANAATADGSLTATYKTDGTGLRNVLPDKDNKRWPAGTTVLKIEGKDVEAYCIEFDNFAVEKTGQYKSTTWAASGVKNLSKAADIAARHTAIGTPMTDKQWEKAATQVAIWHFTDAVGWDKTGSAKFTARVDQLIKGAKDAAESPSSYKVTGTSSVAGEGDEARNVLSAKLTTAAGAPIGGKNLTFVVDGKEIVVKTGADGVAKTDVDATNSARTAKVLFTDKVPAGTVFSPESGKQKMITESPVDVAAAASMGLAAAPAPKPVPTATKTPEGTPTTTAPTKAPQATAAPKPVVTPKPATIEAKPVSQPVPEKLPMTGGEAQGWMLLAALGVAGAGFGTRRHFVKR